MQGAEMVSRQGMGPLLGDRDGSASGGREETNEAEP